MFAGSDLSSQKFLFRAFLTLTEEDLLDGVLAVEGIN